MLRAAGVDPNRRVSMPVHSDLDAAIMFCSRVRSQTPDATLIRSLVKGGGEECHSSLASFPIDHSPARGCFAQNRTLGSEVRMIRFPLARLLRPIIAAVSTSAALLVVLSPAVLATSLSDAQRLVREREQVSEAVQFGSHARLAVAEHWVETGRPLPSAAASDYLQASMLADPDKAVEAIEIRKGTVIITLGGKALPSLAGQVVAISLCEDVEKPYMAVFACGQAICPPSARAVPHVPPAFALTTLDNDRLPAQCRGEGAAYLNGMQNADNGDPVAQAEWAAVLWDGQAVPRDRKNALERARASAGAGNPVGMWILGLFHLHGDPEVLRADRVQAQAWFMRSAQRGFANGVAARDELHALLTPEDRQQAQALVDNHALDQGSD
jgi:TPR repeat protein